MGEHIEETKENVILWMLKEGASDDWLEAVEDAKTQEEVVEIWDDFRERVCGDKLSHRKA